MMIEGGGWEVIDLGVDVGTDKFLKAIDENPDAVIGLSALLTTTMENMKKIVAAIREKHAGSKILVGGAPVTMDYCQKIGADFYSPDPQGAVNYLKHLQLTDQDFNNSPSPNLPPGGEGVDIPPCGIRKGVK